MPSFKDGVADHIIEKRAFQLCALDHRCFDDHTLKSSILSTADTNVRLTLDINPYSPVFLEAEPGCPQMTSFFRGGELSWPTTGELKYTVTCGMGDGTSLDTNQIKSLSTNFKHPITTSTRTTDVSSSCKVTCNPGTMIHAPSK